MNKFLVSLLAGAFALSLGSAAFAADAAKPAAPAKAEVAAPAKAEVAAPAKAEVAEPAKAEKKHVKKAKKSLAAPAATPAEAVPAAK